MAIATSTLLPRPLAPCSAEQCPTAGTRYHESGAETRPSTQHAILGNSLKYSRIPRLLLLGYASQEAQRRYEMRQDWVRFHAILLLKLENIAIVSGLLLAANVNLLVSGELGRMTHASVSASTCLSLLSLLFDLLCLWSLIGVHPTRLKFLVRQTSLFYYLYGSPSLFGGASALSFFVAVGSWTWLDDATKKRGWGGKTCSVALGIVLAVNVGVCFFLGASTEDIPELHRHGPAKQDPAPVCEIAMPLPVFTPPPGD